MNSNSIPFRSDDILNRANQIFPLKSENFEMYSIKPQILSILSDIDNCSSDSIKFEILNTLAVDHKKLIRSDLDILRSFVHIVSSLLRADRAKSLPELGKKWALRVLRWILVVDPQTQDLDDLKQLYPLSINIRDFYLEQLKIGLRKLKESALLYSSLEDFELLKISLNGITGYFKIHPSLMGSEISSAVESVLLDLITRNNIEILSDNFLSNLLIEYSSYFYLSLSCKLKNEYIYQPIYNCYLNLYRLCKRFVDIFEFQVISLLNKDTLNFLKKDNDWFLEWLSEDLEAFKSLSKFIKELKDGEEAKADLESIREHIIDLGRLKGHHSSIAYRDCF